MERFVTRLAAPILVTLAALAVSACGGASTAPPPETARTKGTVLVVPTAIITPSGTTTLPELQQKADSAFVAQKWKEAADAYELLLKADASGPNVPTYLFNAAMAHEGLGDQPGERQKARDRYRELAVRFPESANARLALVRAATLYAYLEEWPALAEIGDQILARKDIDDVDRMVGLGARALAKVEQGNDAGARRDILDGIDISDRTHYSSPEVLPVAAAQLRFAYGEMKRIQSERIKFNPLPSDFLAALEERSVLLLSAQEQYAIAVRSVDPHWAAMAGYRVGMLYRALHHDLMLIPMPDAMKTDRQKQMFFAFMHVRYRVLLEKGLRQMDEALKFDERMNESSIWRKRSEEAKREIEMAIADEKAQIAKFPFTEADIQRTLDDLTKQVAHDKATKAH
jgi:tetratricopeptide (TPR) repeat protein